MYRDSDGYWDGMRWDGEHAMFFAFRERSEAAAEKKHNLIEIMRDGRGLKHTLEHTVHGLMEHFLRRKPDAWPVVEDMVRDSVNYYRLTASVSVRPLSGKEAGRVGS